MIKRIRKELLFAGLLLLGSIDIASAEDQKFDADGVSIRYTDQGTGVPVVLLHGFTSSIEIGWEKTGIVAALLDAGYRVIAYDSRGHGQSGKPLGADNYGMEMVYDLSRLLDHLDIQRAHIVGYSMGAAVAHRFRTVAPERFLSLVLGGYGWGFPGESFRRTLTSEAQARTILESMGRLENNDPAVLLTVLPGFSEWDLSEREIRDNDVPTLVINGNEDERTTYAEAMPDLMPNLSVAVVPGTHSGANSHRRFSAELLSFLEANTD